MESPPKISVIIPVYKVEPYLRQCLDSVVNQTYRNLEIIIIDDGSPDNCGLICDEYAAKDDRITVIHKENGGLSAAWNDGIDASSGEWIAFVDSDDWIDDTYFEKLITGASHAGEIDMILSGSYYEEIGDKRIERVAFLKPFLFNDESRREELQVKVFVATDKKRPHDRITFVWNKLYNASFIKKAELSFDTELRAGLCNDLLFNYLVLGKIHTVCGINYAGYHYRVLNFAGSRRFDLNRPESAHYMLDCFYQYMKNADISPVIWKAFEVFSLAQISLNFQRCFFHKENKEKYRTVAKKIKQMKKMPHYHAAIYSKNSEFISLKQRIMKITLWLPWIWPLKLLHDVNEKRKELVNS